MNRKSSGLYGRIQEDRVRGTSCVPKNVQFRQEDADESMKEFVRFLLILVYALGLISSRGFTRCLLNCSEGIYRLARIRRSLVTSLYRCPEVSIFPRAE